MNTKTILIVAAIIVVLGAGYAVAESSGFWNGMMGSYGTGNGMMGNGGMMGGYGTGNGMMGNGGMMGSYGTGNGMMGNGSMMGSYRTGNGMMENGSMMGSGGMMSGANGFAAGSQCGAGTPDYGANATPLTIDEAKTAVETYLAGTGNTDLKLAEVLQFNNHFYAGIKEKSTGNYAFELIVNKYIGAVGPEMGPNMMWNAKYGHMSIGETEAKVTEEQALKIAQDYLDRVIPGTKVNEADTFYGYYTMEVTKDNKISGMLSVNSNTGAVWYHTWHGTFEKLLEVK
jgi:hypothetical protein